MSISWGGAKHGDLSKASQVALLCSKWKTTISTLDLSGGAQVFIFDFSFFKFFMYVIHISLYVQGIQKIKN